MTVIRFGPLPAPRLVVAAGVRADEAEDLAATAAAYREARAREPSRIVMAGQLHERGRHEVLVCGRASVPGVRYAVADSRGGVVMEELAPHAFDFALDAASGVRLLADHDDRAEYASIEDGTLELRSDGHGLAVRALIDTRRDSGRMLARAIRSRWVRRMSFGGADLATTTVDGVRVVELASLTEVSVMVPPSEPANRYTYVMIDPET